MHLYVEQKVGMFNFHFHFQNMLIHKIAMKMSKVIVNLQYQLNNSISLKFTWKKLCNFDAKQLDMKLN